MQLRDVLPFVIPLAVIQVLILAYYIRHCWKNAALSRWQKAAWIAAIIVFNLPAAAAYLFLSREKPAQRVSDLENADIDAYARHGIFVLVIAAYEIYAMRLISGNAGNPYLVPIVWLAACCFVVLLGNGLFVKDRHRFWYYGLPCLQFVLIFTAEYLDETVYAQFLLLVVAAGVINHYPLRLARYYIIALICAFFIIGTLKSLMHYGIAATDEIIREFYLGTILFSVVLGALYMLKKQMLTSKHLSVTLETLREQSQQIEHLSAIAERGRIAREIHDTVGHRLTGALLSIEAAAGLVPQGDTQAQTKLATAGEQVRNALADIRNSVRLVQPDDKGDFRTRLADLLAEIRRNTGLEIKAIVELQSALLPIQQHVLLRAVMEGATNSIKHGQSTAADLLIQEYKDEVHCTFTDNGAGTDAVAFGFGLKSMQARLQSLGGVLNADSIKGEGFTLSISIPVGKETGGGLA